jgi:CheY-like chemotaxis protein
MTLSPPASKIDNLEVLVAKAGGDRVILPYLKICSPMPIFGNTSLIEDLQTLNASRLRFSAVLHQPCICGGSNAMSGLVLIIEDDPDIAEVLHYAFQKETFSTRVALTGEEGLHASLDRKRPPSVILLDLLLPGMRGLEICRRLRAEPATCNTPILVITAKVFEADVLATLRSGADDYMFKPFLVREVIARTRSLLDRKGLASHVELRN